MPTAGISDKPEAMQVPRTLMERLGMSVNYPVTVYLMGVHASYLQGVQPSPPGQPMPPYQPGYPGGMSESSAPSAPAAWCPPAPTPGPMPPCPGMPGMPMMGTLIVTGTLAFAGADYIDVHVCMTGANVRNVLIPYNAIGMVIPGGPQI